MHTNEETNFALSNFSRMKKPIKILLCISLLINSNPARACDACSCFFGITPYDNQSHIGIIYRYRSFNGYNSMNQAHQFFPDGSLKNSSGNSLHHTDHGQSNKSSEDYEIYRTLQLNARYFISQRFEFNAQIPFKYNSAQYSDEKIKLKGLGDISINGCYHFIKRIDPEKTLHRLIGGAGIKIPTGYYKSNYEEERIDPMLQLGTGTVDYYLMANYVVGIDRYGANVNMNYKISTENSLNERFANSFTINASVFAKFYSGNLNHTFIPKAVCYYEYMKGMYMEDKLMPGTEMNALLLGPQLDYYYKNIMLFVNVQFPVFENQNPNYLSNSGAWNCGLVFNFNQMKYAFK